MQGVHICKELYARIPLLPDATRAVVFGVLSNERDVHGVVKGWQEVNNYFDLVQAIAEIEEGGQFKVLGILQCCKYVSDPRKRALANIRLLHAAYAWVAAGREVNTGDEEVVEAEMKAIVRENLRRMASFVSTRYPQPLTQQLSTYVVSLDIFCYSRIDAYLVDYIVDMVPAIEPKSGSFGDVEQAMNLFDAVKIAEIEGVPGISDDLNVSVNAQEGSDTDDDDNKPTRASTHDLSLLTSAVPTFAANASSRQQITPASLQNALASVIANATTDRPLSSVPIDPRSFLVSTTALDTKSEGVVVDIEEPLSQFDTGFDDENAKKRKITSIAPEYSPAESQLKRIKTLPVLPRVANTQPKRIVYEETHMRPMVTQIYAGRASAFFESETQLRRADSLAEFERTTLASAIAETDKQWIEKSRAAAETLTILRENLFETKYKQNMEVAAQANERIEYLLKLRVLSKALGALTQ